MVMCFDLGANPECHCTASVTVFEVAPPIEMTTGTADPLGTPAGTSMFTWYKPTKPGARPEKSTFVEMPPIATVGLVVVTASGLYGAAAPLGGWFVTRPRPVQ